MNQTFLAEISNLTFAFKGNLTLVQRLLLYDFLEERDGQLVLPLDFVELLDLYSDDSDEWSDSETN